MRFLSWLWNDWLRPIAWMTLIFLCALGPIMLINHYIL